MNFPRPLFFLRWMIYIAGLSALWLFLNQFTLRQLFVARTQRNENIREVHTLEDQRAELETEIDQLATHGFSTEKAIRDRLKYIKQGEKVIILEGDPFAQRDEEKGDLESIDAKP